MNFNMFEYYANNYILLLLLWAFMFVVANQVVDADFSQAAGPISELLRSITVHCATLLYNIKRVFY